jgi:chromosome segregation ATPase
MPRLAEQRTHSVTNIESDYDTGWREGYEAASGATIAEVERIKANHGDVVEEVQRRHDAVVPLTAEIEQLRAELAEVKQRRDTLQRERDIFNDQAEHLTRVITRVQALTGHDPRCRTLCGKVGCHSRWHGPCAFCLANAKP